VSANLNLNTTGCNQPTNTELASFRRKTHNRKRQLEIDKLTSVSFTERHKTVPYTNKQVNQRFSHSLADKVVESALRVEEEVFLEEELIVGWVGVTESVPIPAFF